MLKMQYFLGYENKGKKPVNAHCSHFYRFISME